MLPGITDNNTFSVIWDGWLDVTKSGHGDYTFGTASDDGSVVYVDLNNDGVFDPATELVVSNNKIQPTTVKTGTVTLNMNLVHVLIGYFESEGGQSMEARFAKGTAVAWGSMQNVIGAGPYFQASNPNPITPSYADWAIQHAGGGTPGEDYNILNGSVNAAGASTSVSFEYGLTTNYGTTVVTDPATVSGTGTTAVSKAIDSLTAGATYHYRVDATNPNGTTQGADMTFTTTSDNPDGDNYDNLIEYAFNLSPANGVGSPFFINPSTVSTGRVELSFTRPVGATTSVTYYLEYSSALGPATSWISIALTTINPRNLVVTPLTAGLETVTIRNLEAREGFVRFRAELDANGDWIIDHISYTGVEGWTESAMELGTRTYNNPYQHSAVFTGTVDATAGVTGQTLHFVTSAGTTGLATLLTPGASYYLEVTAGVNEGQRFDVVSATGSALTLATVSDVCSDTHPFNTLAGVLPATLAGNRIAIHRHWALGSLKQ